MLLRKSKVLILVLLSFSLTSFFFGTDYNFLRIDGSFDNYDSNIIAESYTATNLTDVAANGDETTASDAPLAQPNQTVWARLREEFRLNHQTQSVQVQKEIRALVADKEKFYQILQASAPYIYFIAQQVQDRKFPAELALLPVIESEFNPHNVSNKGASGLWQLMPQTARDLGIKVKSGYDGRENVVKSTNAALAYFNDLQHLFKGNWYLALAAYNSGEGMVEHAERSAGSTNFFDLDHLPKETKVYVPKLLAVAAIIQDPKKYGFQLPPVKNAPYFAVAKVNKPVQLSKIAKATGINNQELQVLNPEYRKGGEPSKGSTVLVPVADVAEVKSQFGEAVTV